MNEHDESWARWGEAWRSGPDAGRAVDVEALRRRLRRERRRSAAVIAVEALIAACALLWALVLMRSDVPRDVMTGVVVAAFTAIVLALAIWVRRGSLADTGDSLLETLSLAVRRGEIRARVFVATYAAAATALGFLAALWQLRRLDDFAGITGRIVVAGCVLALLVAVTAWRDRRNRAELARLRQLVEALRDTESERRQVAGG